MFGWLGKLRRRRDEDYDELRSTVLGERPFDVPRPFEQPPQQPPSFPPSRGYEDFTPRTREVFEPIETPSFPASFEKPPEPPSRNYEILDRLAIIESQLAAVRSMTETINERLKNLEVRLGTQRRY